MSKVEGENGKVDEKGSGTGTDNGEKPNGEERTTETVPIIAKDDNEGLRKALESERKLHEKAKKALKDKELESMPELEAMKTVNADLTVENTKLRKENLQFKVGSDLKLPSRFWKKIDGESEEDMRRDAAEMFKDLKLDVVGDGGKSTNDGRKPPTNDGKKTGSTGKPDMNALIRAAAGK